MKIKKILIVSVILNVFLLILVGYFIKNEGGFNLIKNKLVSNENIDTVGINPFYKNKVSIFESKKTKDGSIIFIGDSLTDFNEWKESFPEYNVYNRGINSDTTEGVIKRLKPIVDSKPSKLFILIGINDLGLGVPKNYVVSNYEKILNDIKEKSPNTQVYVQSILPTNSDISSLKINYKDITFVNKQLVKLSDKYDYRYVNIYHLFVDKENKLAEKWTTDGIHLNGDAYSVWEKEIRKLIQ